MKQGQVVTFYSYKGGVGRTMALANVAVLLARWGYKTLMVDWDLEAPGLEYFFKDYLDVKSVAENKGVVDLLSSASGDLSSSHSLDWRKLQISISLPESKELLYLLTAGERSNGYFGKVRGFDIDAFYEERKGGLFIEALRDEWKQNFDFVLIDSRTGVTDIGGICTIQLPDILVLLFTATEQGFHGAIDIARRALTGRQQLPVDRLRLLSVPIPTRFDTDKEFQISQQWLTDFANQLSEICADWLPKKVDARAFLEATKLPYIPYFSFGEKLAVIEQGVYDPAGLGYAYETLASVIGNNLESVEQVLDNRSEFVRAASQSETSTLKSQVEKEQRITLETFNNESLVLHSKWLDSNGRAGKRLDLTGALLKGINLANINLRKAILSESDLSDSILRKVDLSGAILDGANLRGANLILANLQEAHLADANLSGTELVEAKLIRVNLKNSDLRNAILYGADLNEAQLEGAKLTEANLSAAKLSGVNFNSVDLRRAVLRSADLQDADLTNAQGLAEEQFSGTNLSGVKLPSDFEFESLKDFNQKQWSLNIRYWLIIIASLLAFLIDLLSKVDTSNAGNSFYKQVDGIIAPFLNSISVSKFYIAVPAILLGLYIHFQLYLQQVWTSLAAMPSVFPDGKPLSKKIQPNFIGSVVQLFSKRKNYNTVPSNPFQGLMTALTIWYAAPSVIIYYLVDLLMLYRTLDKGDYYLSDSVLASFSTARLTLFSISISILLAGIAFNFFARRLLRR